MCNPTDATPRKASNGTLVQENGHSNGFKQGSEEENGHHHHDWSSGHGLIPGREVIGPLLLITTCPIFSIVFYHVVAQMEGHFAVFGQLCWKQGFFATFKEILPTPWDPVAWKMILGFFAFQLALQKFLPGERFEATVTPKGNRPVYKANGMLSYIVTLTTFIGLTYMGYIRPALVFDKFGNILASLNVFAFLLCFTLLIKGHVSPCTTDSGTNGNVVKDFYWGMELYPQICGFDVKQFTNCRAGMMFWAVGILCFAHKNMEVHGGSLQLGMAVNVCLQLVYIAKFFYWEMGYMCSMDIQVDRAGFYLCWGCLVWIPSVYTSHSFYMAQHGPALSPTLALCIFLFGLAMICLNYDSDNQRYVFRQTHGECTIWGKVPRKIVANYKTGCGLVRTSLLLVDGWWRWSRHFHYVPEILAALAWSLPGLKSGFIGPYFYVIFLIILLTDRSFRDDHRCRKKYGLYWEEYCEVVPYKIIPGIL